MGSQYTFAVLYFARENLSVSLPSKNLEKTVREPLSFKQAQVLLESMSEHRQALDTNWKTRNRKNAERLSSGEPMQLFAVYRGLHDLKAKKGSLNNSDRQQFNLSLDLLTEEFSAALGKTIEQTQSLIEQTVADEPNAA